MKALQDSGEATVCQITLQDLAKLKACGQYAKIIRGPVTTWHFKNHDVHEFRQNGETVYLKQDKNYYEQD